MSLLKFRRSKRVKTSLCLPLLFVVLNVSTGYAGDETFRADENTATVTQQQGTVRGRVTDEAGESLPGVRTDWEEIEGTAAWRNDWTMLADVYIVPPSGAIEQHEWTAEDLAWAQSGIDLEFATEHSNTPFRYLRIEAYDNLARTELMHFVEWEIYGNLDIEE